VQDATAFQRHRAVPVHPVNAGNDSVGDLEGMLCSTEREVHPGRLLLLRCENSTGCPAPARRPHL
jgi:hypothetical protein